MLRTTLGDSIQGIQCIQNKNGMNQKDHKKWGEATKTIGSVTLFDVPGQHAQPPLGSASETASGIPWKYLQFKIGH